MKKPSPLYKLLSYKRASARKSQLLGMPFGTANGRLRKQIMFHLVQRLGLDICYRCNKEISVVSEFSLEHIKAWQSSEDPVQTFFDLNNIAFSHHSCNVAAAVQITKLDLTPDERKAHKRENQRKSRAQKKLLRTPPDLS